ncbi:hypothetical protein CANTEDRAFT_133767 [Yamadazyma tenuis ATCC 10573]|uniref:Uncharacterized protein n=1 Tax=Candida tenuis (strain ATCC 10573 / BCRC 21748 / CBS 615 / JCM 9827 / NBRC 10315 / NRRL Y-1498 / VKM Y-70) TaxID=590646 RepID=G3B1J2_CANTC|nr:uncharacterized protein CANTEDRAFT_133767 [Yamadazyma tenuis ATCC 10573]EGV64457.1 hypothetical protein CANTEDRAFT_133767 [Yamadazyma tenuis ATCC 10573]
MESLKLLLKHQVVSSLPPFLGQVLLLRHTPLSIKTAIRLLWWKFQKQPLLFLGSVLSPRLTPL